jgi:hypothetical protein
VRSGHPAILFYGMRNSGPLADKLNFIKNGRLVLPWLSQKEKHRHPSAACAGDMIR